MCILRYKPTQGSIGIENCGCVVIDAGCALFEQRRNEYDFMSCARRPRNFCDEGPGIGSARSNSAWSSRWQKYCV